jgi:hypothetical protein
MSEKILCVKVECGDTPPLIGESFALMSLLETVYGTPFGMPDGTEVKLTFQRMTWSELGELGDWSP